VSRARSAVEAPGPWSSWENRVTQENLMDSRKWWEGARSSEHMVWRRRRNASSLRAEGIWVASLGQGAVTEVREAAEERQGLGNMHVVLVGTTYLRSSEVYLGE